MNKAIAKIKFITPCISSGANQKVAEIRAQSLRGELHYWFRSLGGRLPEERRIFGRIGKEKEIRRSSLNVRIVVPENLRTSCKDGKSISGDEFDYFLWPLREQKHTPGSGSRGIIEAGESFELRISHVRIQDGKLLPEEVLKAFLLLGSLGSRSRRCYGSLWAESVSIDGQEWKVPVRKEDFINEVIELIAQSNISASFWGDAPSWKEAVELAKKTLKSYRCGSPKSGTPSHWGKNDHDVPLKGRGTAYRPILGLPLQQRYSTGKGTWRSTIDGNDRWASPLRLKIVPLDGKYNVLALFMGDELMEPTTQIQLKGKGRPIKATLSDDLWYALKEEGEQIL